MEVWGGDGRLTAGHLAALRRWAAAGLLITLIDRTTVARPRPGESEKEMGRLWWGERDAAMAGRVLAAPAAPGGRLVVAGDLHTRLEPLPAIDPIAAEIGVPMGAELARRRAALRSINSVYGPGQFYSLGPRRSDPDGLPGQHIDTPRLIMQHGAVLLQGAIASRGDSPAPRAAGSIVRVTLPASRSADFTCPIGGRRVGEPGSAVRCPVVILGSGDGKRSARRAVAGA